MERYFQKARERIEEPAEGSERGRARVSRKIRINSPPEVEERAEDRDQTEDEQKENAQKNQKKMRELLKFIRSGNSDNAKLNNIIYFDLDGHQHIGFENVVGGMADDIHELAENNS